MSIIEVATIHSGAHADRMGSNTPRRDSLSPLLGLGAAALISAALWAGLFNVVTWIATTVF